MVADPGMGEVMKSGSTGATWPQHVVLVPDRLHMAYLGSVEWWCTSEDSKTIMLTKMKCRSCMKK